MFCSCLVLEPWLPTSEALAVIGIGMLASLSYMAGRPHPIR
jgi:hypothetical protein